MFTDFEYADKRLSDFGWTVGHIDSNVGVSEIDIGCDITFNTVKNNHSSIHYKTSTSYDNVYTSQPFDIFKDPCDKSQKDMYATHDEIRVLMTWLNRREYRKFKPLYDSDEFSNIHYYGSFNVKEKTIGDKIIGLVLTFTSNAPYGFDEQVKNIHSVDYSTNTANGKTIVTTDSVDAPMKNFKLFGKSKQNTVPGNQLIDFVSYIKNWYNSDIHSDVDINGDEIYFDNVGNINMWNEGAYIPFEGEEGKQYTLSAELKCGTCELYGLGFKYSDGTTSKSERFTNTDWFDVSLTSETGKTVIGFGTNYNTFDTSGYIRNVMLCEGTEVKPYEPYVGGEVSPNMKYPQEVKSLGESGSIEQKILTANMFNEDTAILSGDPNLKFPITHNTFVWVETDIKVKPNDVFYIYYSINGVFNAQPTFYINSKLSSSSGNVIKVTNNIAHITWDGVLFVRMDLITYDGTETVDNLVISKVPITEFEDYSEQPITFQTPNGLKGVPLGITIPSYIASSEIHMSGVYWDEEEGQYYIGDTKNENGKDVQRIGEYIFDGSADEGIIVSNRNTIAIPIDNTFTLPTVNDKYPALCSHGMMETWNRVANLYEGICIYDGCFRLYDSDICNGTTDLIVELLKNSPLTLTYVLAEPIITDITEEEQSQLDALHMNQPNTIIVNDAGAYMEVEYINKFDNTFSIYSDSDEIGILYPNVTVTCKQSGTLIIENTTTGTVTSVENCLEGETIYFNGEHKFITSDNENHTTLYNDFINYEWLDILVGDNMQGNLYKVNMPSDISVDYKPIRKVGV